MMRYVTHVKYLWCTFTNLTIPQISFFLGDYSNAIKSAQAFDLKLSTDAIKISEDYASLVPLSIRQALGSIEITVSKDANGTYNTDDVLIFMKGMVFLTILSAIRIFTRIVEISSSDVND